VVPGDDAVMFLGVEEAIDMGEGSSSVTFLTICTSVIDSGAVTAVIAVISVIAVVVITV
jgi:hypothetical protein